MKGKQKIFIGLDGVKEQFIDRPNRNTTLESLEAAVKLILADNKEDYCKYYAQATHDYNGGAISWYYLTQLDKNREYQQKKRDEAKKLNDTEGFNFENI